MRVDSDKILSRKSAAWYHAWWLAACALLALLIGAALKSTAWAAPGDLDPAFSGDGLQTTDFDGNLDLAYAVGVQSTGRIVVAGWAYSDTTNEFALVRYRLNGTLDTSFDGDGRVTTDFQNGSDHARDLVILGDDKILVAGTAETTAGGSDLGLARYNSDGSPDNSFSGNGRVATDLDGHIQLGYALALQQDGKILVAGSTRAPTGSSDFIVARYHLNGNLDTTFGGDGMVTTDFSGGSDVAYAVVAQPDGQILVAGSASASNLDFGLARYNTDGSLDTSFSFDGMTTVDFDGGNDHADDVALDSSGRIIVVGGAEFTTYNFGLARLLANGSLDTTLSGNGKANSDFGGSDAATSLIVQPDGKLLVIGSSGAAPGGANSFALARYRANGTLDTSFSADGMVLTLFGQANAGALLNDNRIVAVGFATNDFGAAVYQYDPPSTATPTSTATGTATNTATRTPTTVSSATSIATATRTNVAAGTTTPTPPAGATPCPMSFIDVLTTDYFYEPVRYLYCRGIISGYADQTFRPYNNTTRGQLSKIVVGVEGWAIDTTGGPHFSDVPITDAFYPFVETARAHNIISGYDTAERCAPQATPCFKPFDNVTRGQLSKIVVSAEGWALVSPAAPTFVDVLPSNPFYREIETAVSKGIISGYDLPGGAREFRWHNNATRGQISKIVYMAVLVPAK